MLVVVFEYLIRTVADHGWPGFPAANLSDVLMPDGYGCAVSDGWGDFRMVCSGATVSFSGEDVGWQVAVEGRDDRTWAEALITAITSRVSAACGESCEWLALS